MYDDDYLFVSRRTDRLSRVSQENTRHPIRGGENAASDKSTFRITHEHEPLISFVRVAINLGYQDILAKKIAWKKEWISTSRTDMALPIPNSQLLPER